MPSKATFRRPADGRIVSLAGPRSYVGRYGNMHYGVDIGAQHGGNVRAAWAGTVTHNYGSGNNRTLVLRHFDGTSTGYLHNSQNLVRVGQRVESGQVIAKVGTAGTGPHLHFEYHPSGWYSPSQAQINATNNLLRGSRNDGSSNPGGGSSSTPAPATGGSSSGSSSSSSSSKPGSLAQAGFYRATTAASLHTSPDSKAKKVRDVQEGDLLIVTQSYRQTEWWLQVGTNLWVQRARVERRTTGGPSEKAYHGEYPDRVLPVNGTGTRELEKAWRELFLRIGWWKGNVASSMWQYFGHLGYTGTTNARAQKYLRARGFYKLRVDNIRGPGQIRGEKSFLNGQRQYFTPRPVSHTALNRAYNGKVY